MAGIIDGVAREYCLTFSIDGVQMLPTKGLGTRI